MFFSQYFCLKLPVKITMGKGIVRIYKYDQQKCPCPSTNKTSVIPSRFDTSIKTQRNSSSDESVGENDLSSAVLDQSTNHHGNTDVNDNDDSQSFETPQKNNLRFCSFGDKTTPQPHHDHPHSPQLKDNIYFSN